MLPSQKSSADFTDVAEILGSRRGTEERKTENKNVITKNLLSVLVLAAQTLKLERYRD